MKHKSSSAQELRYIAFWKPYGVLSQFTPEDGARSLAEFSLPAGVYPAGRLDKDSEGLLLLTNDGPLIHRLLEPRYDKQKTYWAQIERMPTEASLNILAMGGIPIQDYKTRPCELRLLMQEPQLPPRDPPIRHRLNVPTCWLEIKLHEGKNRQVRRMTAHIGHPTLRLVRYAIGQLTMEGLAPGKWKDISLSDIL